MHGTDVDGRGLSSKVPKYRSSYFNRSLSPWRCRAGLHCRNAEPLLRYIIIPRPSAKVVPTQGVDEPPTQYTVVEVDYFSPQPDRKIYSNLFGKEKIDKIHGGGVVGEFLYYKYHCALCRNQVRL
jgi:hypothetical protein